MDFNPNKCPKCKGRSYFHVADRIAFGGDKSHFSLAAQAEIANLMGLRIQSAKDELVALITKSDAKTSSTVRLAKKRGIRIMSPLEFEKELKTLCDGNVPDGRNPSFAKSISSGGKIFAWGLSAEDEKTLNRFLKLGNITRGSQRKSSLALAITSSIHINSGSAKILKSLGVPVYDFSKIKKNLGA